MFKCERALNAFYSKMIHVTCASHGLHRVAEEVREDYDSVDQPISNVEYKWQLVRVILCDSWSAGVRDV